MSLGLIGHPAAASYSVDSESLPSGRMSPTLMVISVSAVSSFRRRLASRSWAAKSKCLPVPRRLAIFPAMQAAAEAIQDHRLTLSALLQALVAEGIVPKADADKLIADRRLHRGDHHPLVVIADQKWRSLKPPQKVIFLEGLAEWLARQTGMEYFHIDPLKINFSAVTEVMSSHYAARFKILPVAVNTREVVIATCEPYLKDWEKELKQMLRLEIRRVIANPLDISRYQVVELDLVAADIERIGDDAADLEAQHLLQLLFPVLEVGLAGRDPHLARARFDRQDLEAGRVMAGHHLGDRGEIDLERIDVEVVHPGLAGEPLGEPFDAEDLLRGFLRAPFLVGDHDQRMMVAAVQPAIGGEAVRGVPEHQALGRQGPEDLGERQA